MITVDGLTVEFGGTTLFRDIFLPVINEKDRIALMGKEWRGERAHCLKILAGVRQRYPVEKSQPKDSVIAYLPQHLMTEDGTNRIPGSGCQAFAHLHEMQAEIDAHQQRARLPVPITTAMITCSLSRKYPPSAEKFYAIDMTHFEEDVEKALLGLGFSAMISTARPASFQRRMEHAHRAGKTALEIARRTAA